MKLATRLKIFGFFAAVLVIILGIVVYWTFYQVHLTFEKNTIVNDIVTDTFTLTVLSDEYIQLHGERARVQWLLEYKHLHANILQYEAESVDEKNILTELRTAQEQALIHFSKSQGPLTQDLEMRLNDQLSIDMQKIVSLVSVLSENNTRRLSNILQGSLAFLLSITFILGLSLIVTYFLFARNIATALKQLIEGTKILGSGYLDFRFSLKRNDEFGQLARSFNEMANKLKKLDTAKSEFVVLASHQLRTPLTIINWYAELLLSGSKGKLNKQQKSYLTKLYEGGKRMVNLSNSLLIVSRFDLGTYTMKPATADIKNVVAVVLKEFQSTLKKKKITLRQQLSTDLPELHIEPNLLTSIFENLLSNSVVYTPNGGKIQLSVEKIDTNILITIIDSGIGIPTDQKSQISTKFFRAENAKSIYVDGVGLGLYLIKSILGILDGEIWFESEEGKGSTFYVKFPIATVKP